MLAFFGATNYKFSKKLFDDLPMIKVYFNLLKEGLLSSIGLF